MSVLVDTLAVLVSWTGILPVLVELRLRVRAVKLRWKPIMLSLHSLSVPHVTSGSTIKEFYLIGPRATGDSISKRSSGGTSPNSSKSGTVTSILPKIVGHRLDGHRPSGIIWTKKYIYLVSQQGGSRCFRLDCSVVSDAPGVGFQ